MKKLLLNLLRWAVPLAIIAYLVVQARQNDSFAVIRDQDKHWNLIALATLFCFGAVMLTMVRWYYLVRALDIPLNLRDALRLGFMGYLFNFVTPGGVGGDFFKLVFLARDRPGKRMEVAVTVIVDRIIGLYALFLVATAAMLYTGINHSDDGTIRLICRIMFWSTGISTVGLIVVAMPGFAQGRLAKWLETLPKIGGFVERLTRAQQIYSRKPGVMVAATVMSLGVHSLFTIGLWLAARGLLNVAPSLADNFVVVPVAMATGVLPLAPNGVGTFEFLFNYMYQHLPDGTVVAASAGLVVALAYRLITVFIAMVGAVAYFFSKKEAADALHEAEDDVRTGHDPADESQPAASSS